jgi:CubicO group peptidase (beta-lactamase class C family)
MGNTYSAEDAAWARGFVDPAFIRFALTRGRESAPSRRVWRGGNGPWVLPEKPSDLDDLPVTLPNGASLTLLEFLAGAESDALLVLHRGAVVYERYLHGMRPHDLHLNASMAKSWVGLLAAVLIHDGVLDRAQCLRWYVPELAGTAFGDVTIQDLLHMSTLMSYSGRPFNKELEAQRYFAAVGTVPRPADYAGPVTIMEHLATARTSGSGGTEFRYENGNVEAIAEAMRRVSGTSTADLLSERLWSHIGAAEDGYFALDSTGTEMACGGFSATIRDISRIGEMLRCGGAVGARQIVPESVVAGLTDVPDGPASDVLARGQAPGAANQPAMGYHDFWWVPYDGHKSFEARGIHGQRLYVSPGLEMVVAHYGSHVMSPSVPVPPFEAVFRQIGAHLGQ